MAGQQSALQSAYRRLTPLLGDAHEVAQRNVSAVTTPELRHAIERFVGQALADLETAAELERRAGLVENLCGRASEFATARAAAVRQRPRLSGIVARKWKLIFPGDLSSHSPRFLSEVERDSNAADWILRCDGALTKQGTAAFESLRTRANEVIVQCEPLEVDGCHYLWHLHAGRLAGATEWSRAIVGWLDWPILSWLGNVEGAAKALVDALERAEQSHVLPPHGEHIGKPGEQTNGTGTAQPKVIGQNEERDAWLYDLRFAGQLSDKQMAAKLRQECAPRRWEAVSESGVRAAIKRYLDRHPTQPVPPRRQRGRRPR